MATVTWRSKCSQCGGKTTWCGDAGDPDAPKDGEWIVCLSCLVFGKAGIPLPVKREPRSACVGLSAVR